MRNPRDTGWKEGGTPAPPEVVSSSPVYRGRVVDLRVDEILLPDGRTTTREVVDHPGAVVIVALDEQEEVYLVRQYRHAIGRTLLELPAGTLEPGESPLDTAKRELREEVGVVAKTWRPLGSFYSSPGFLNEELHVFLAQDLQEGECDPDFDEDLTVVRMPLAEFDHRVHEIADAKTLAALHLLQGAAWRGTQP